MGACPCSGGELGIARSELYPTLAVAALSQTTRQEAFLATASTARLSRISRCSWTLTTPFFDFGGRSGRINAARAQLLAANFAFNDSSPPGHLPSAAAYYRLLSSMGQEESARASLSNAEAVQQAAEDRLANGLATLPDVLEARSATAQAEYDLQAMLELRRLHGAISQPRSGAPRPR